MSPVDPGQLDRALAAIRKQYGESTARLGNTYETPEKVTTGSLELDNVIRGGIPRGRMCHFYGPFQSGKSLVAISVASEFQKRGLLVALYNAENQYDPAWWTNHGVDVEKLIVIDNTKIEEIGATMETLLPSIHLHIVDSVPACVSIDELAAENEEWRPGISARAWGKTFRRINASFDNEQNTVIWINHLGTAFSKYTADAPTGGKNFERFSSLSLEFGRASYLFRDKDGHLKVEGEGEASFAGSQEKNKDKAPSGLEFKVTAKKTRQSPVGGIARLRMDLRTGEFDDLWSLVKAAEFYGLVTKGGSWYTLPDGKKMQGDGGLREYIKENPDFKDQIIQKIGETA
jgi:recombination protein RecA